MPHHGTGINRKPCALAVARGQPGMCWWPPGCLFGVKAAGSCWQEPGSTRLGIACELIATSRGSLQHPRGVQGRPASGPPCRAPSFQPYVPAGLGAHAGASPGVGVPGKPQHGGHGKPWGRAGLGPAEEPMTHSCLDVLVLNYSSVRPGPLPKPPKARAGRGAGQVGAGSHSQLCLCSWGQQEEGSRGAGGPSHTWDLLASTRSSGGTVSCCSV